MHDEGHALTLLELVEGTVYKPSLRTIREKGKDMFTGVLSREYEIRADNYNIGGNNVFNFYPVNLLLSQPRVWEIIKMFRFFRFQAIEVRCLVRSLPQQQGFFLVGLFPCKVDGSNTYCDASVPTDPIVLPITDQSSASIRAEWLSPMDWGLINDPNDSGSVSQLGSISDMWIIRSANVVADKTDSSVSSVVTVRWYARFIAPEVNIPTSIYTAPVEAQASTLLDVTSTVGTFVGGTIMAEGTKMVKDYITGSVKGVFDTIIEDDSPEPDTTQQAGFTLSAFGQTAYSSRKQAGQSLSLFPDKRLLRPERYGDKTMEHKIRDIIKTPQLEYIGIVPDISAPLKFVCRPSSHEFGAGADNLSRGYLAYMSQFFRFWRGSIKYHFSFTISSLNSARVYIRLDTSKMVPGTYAQMVSDSPCEVITVKGTVFKTLVVPFISSAPREPTCKPDTIAGISTLYEQYWPKLYVCAEATGSGDRTPTVSCILHCTAGDDFVFESYQSAVSGPFAPEEKKRRKTVQAQSRVSEMDKINETFQGVLVPTAVPWDLTIEHLISRWSDARKTEDVTFPFIDRRVESRRLAFTNNFDLLAGNFLFNAGSVRHKIAAPSSFTGVCSVEKQVVRWWDQPMTNSQRPDAGVVATDAQEWSIMDFQSPLFNYMDVYTMEEGASSRLLFNNEITAESNPISFEVAMHWFKAGVNFQLFCLLPVMKRDNWPLIRV